MEERKKKFESLSKDFELTKACDDAGFMRTVSGSSVQEIDTRFLLTCESTNLSVERPDQDKDADENVDADQIRTGRPVESEQPTVLFSQREDIDIDFRVSGLPHSVERNKPKILVFVSSSGRSRTTLIDKILKPICNKVMPTTHIVKNQRR